MRILLIGNSYTYYNDMPLMFETLARANGNEVEVDAVTRGGSRLYQHLDETGDEGKAIRALLAEGRYDVLVLQEQSHTPITDPKVFLDGARGLTELVSSVRTIFYATWGRKDGCPLLDELGLTSLGMTMSLEMAYERMAKLLSGELAAVGRAFAAIGAVHPEVELFGEDMSHPSYIGSAVAATVLYKTIFGSLPEVYNGISLDDTVITIIKEIIDGI